MPRSLTAGMLLEHMRKKSYKPLTLSELAQALHQRTKAQRKQLHALLAELESQGLVVKTRADRYGVPEKMNLVVGTLQGHPHGYAFLIPDREGRDDVFVAASDLNGAMHGDRVIVRLSRRGRNGRRAEGEVIRILQRANHQIVGRLERYRHYGFVTPSDRRLHQDVYIAAADLGDAQTGDIVVAEITQWPQQRRGPAGSIVDVLGREGDPGVDIAAIIAKYGLPTAFSPAAARAAAAVPQEVDPQALAGRLDLRDVATVTIDGADAKDLDDAVSLEPGTRGRWRLGVHIADVSHYVGLGSALDREARERGVSVYLVDRVLPMLPPELSNGICSLNPHVDRLALSVLMEIDAAGAVVDYEIAPSVIRSDGRLTYEQVDRILADPKAEERQALAPFVPMLEEMHALARILYERRIARGGIDFDFPEARVELAPDGTPLAIERVSRTPATQLIEEFMILCNETVAQHFHRRRIPFLYRIHEPPKESAVAAFAEFARSLGYSFAYREGQAPRPQAFQRLLAEIAGRPEAFLLSTVMLRSMERARYLEENLGHFGLASTCYSHFTAPIRRYPDLVIHRITKAALAGTLDELNAWLEQLPEIAAHASQRERRAEEAERESVDLKMAEYMERRLGDVFAGLVAGVTNFGLFVQLPNTVEGLVHVSTMTDDYYYFDEQRYTLIGERSGRRFRIGDPVTVQVVRVDRAERTIDFQLVEDDDGDDAGDRA